MEGLLRAVLSEPEDAADLKRDLKPLRYHLQENHAFFPAKNTMEEMMQSALRAEHLTEKRFVRREEGAIKDDDGQSGDTMLAEQCDVIENYLLHPEKKRWWVEAAASSGKTYVLVQLLLWSLLRFLQDWVKAGMKEGVAGQRSLVVCHSKLLRRDLIRYWLHALLPSQASSAHGACFSPVPSTLLLFLQH